MLSSCQGQIYVLNILIGEGGGLKAIAHFPVFRDLLQAHIQKICKQKLLSLQIGKAFLCLDTQGLL
jgi:hypothetical protein